MKCVECGKETMLIADQSKKLAIADYEYHICSSCMDVSKDRRWTCSICGQSFLGKLTLRPIFHLEPPYCPTCGKTSKGKVSAVLIPERFRGLPAVAKLWRSTMDDAAVQACYDQDAPAHQAIVAQQRAAQEADAQAVAQAKEERSTLQAACSASYLGGHPEAAKGENVTVGFNASGVRVFSEKSGRLLFGIPWSSIARINHVLSPKGKPMDQASMTVALYGASGRAGPVGDWAAALGAIGSMFDRDKHFVSIILRTPDGFEGAVGFESKAGETLANALSAERLRVGQQAQPAAPAAGGDVMAKLKELAGLRDAGIITADEFATKKSELLARL